MTVWDLAFSLVLTLLLEETVALVWGVRRRDLLLVALVNVLTNPPVVLLHALFPGWGMTLLLEAGAVAVEGACYRRLGGEIQSPWRFALLANAISFCLGLVLDQLI